MESSDTSAPGAQPAATDQAPQEGVKPPVVQETTSALDAFDSAALMAALEDSESGEPRATAPPASQEVIEEAPVAPAVEAEPAPAHDAPQAENTEGNGNDASRGPQRVSLRALPSEQQVQIAQALDMVRTGAAPDMTAALLQITGRTAPAAAATAEGQVETPPADPAAETASEPKVVTEIQSSLKSLREQRREAIENFDRATETRLTEEIEDLQLDLLRAEQAATVQATNSRSYQQSYVAAVDTMEASYDEALDENSAFSRVLDDRIAAAQARRDPALADPNFILSFADEVADMLGIAKKTAAGPTAPKAPASPAPTKPARPVGSGLAPGTQTAARPTPEQMSSMIREMPIEELEKLVFTE